MRSCTVICVLLAITVTSSCIKPYNPPNSRGSSFLVVEGTLLGGEESTFKLTRSRALNDTSNALFETNANLLIEGESGETYGFVEQPEGIYVSSGSAVAVGKKYRLKIQTANGSQYMSDFETVKNTPDIDSVSWEQPGRDEVNIYVNTHDPENKTKNYRWEYIETYESHAAYSSYLDFQNGELVFLEPDQYRDVCYTTNRSEAILIANTNALSNDVIYRMPIISVPNDNSKISVRYSILVRQYALSAEAYQYWQILKQNSEPEGGLFDPQPSLLQSNIHCTSDPGEQVIGYLSACSRKEQRIFIRWGQLKGRTEIDNSALCKAIDVPREDVARYLTGTNYLPAYMSGVGGTNVGIVPAVCVDCRKRGGVLTKPDFW